MAAKKRAKKKAAKKRAKKKTSRHATVKNPEVIRECTQLEDNFARLFAISGNAAQSYVNAGYADCGQNNKTQGWKLLQKEHIQQRVDEYRQLIDAKLDIRTERILAELAAIAFLDPLDVLDFSQGVGPEGYMGQRTMVLKDLTQMPRYARAAIASIEEVVDPTGETHLKVKFHPKVQALTKILEYKTGQLGEQRRRAVNVSLNLSFDAAEASQVGQKKVKTTLKID